MNDDHRKMDCGHNLYDLREGERGKLVCRKCEDEGAERIRAAFAPTSPSVCAIPDCYKVPNVPTDPITGHLLLCPFCDTRWTYYEDGWTYFECGTGFTNDLSEHDMGDDCSDRVRAERDALKGRCENQAERIRYLEGATNHATGTPLTKALERAEKAEARVRKLEDEIDRWKLATGLERGGDPDMITPVDLEAEIARLREALGKLSHEIARLVTLSPPGALPRKWGELVSRDAVVAVALRIKEIARTALEGK